MSVCVFIPEDETYVFSCPWCENKIQVKISEINCSIFRHAVMKNTGNQVNPHASKEECENLVISDMIYGCGKPFMLFKNGNSDTLEAKICDYL